MISKLKPNQIFVFGSNLTGIHLGGAALQAINFGAVNGIGEGLQRTNLRIPNTRK